MKKLLIFVSALVLSVFLVSCGETYTAEFVLDKQATETHAVVEFKAGKTVELPADPTKEGVSFGGWYTNPSLTIPFDANEAPAESLIIYAKWLSTLTFDSMGGSAVEPITAAVNSTFVFPENPVREGYVFIGWYLDKEYTTEQTFIMPAQNRTVYAKWQVYDEDTSYPLGSWVNNNPKAYTETVAEDGSYTYTSTADKGEWDYVKSMIECNAKVYNVVRIKVKGTAGCDIIIKLQGGSNSTVIETRFTLTGEVQTYNWVVTADNFTDAGGQMFLWFLNPGVKGANADAPEYVTFYEAGLYRTVDEAEAGKEAALFFNTNGGTPIDTMFVAKNSNVTIPTTTKEGAIFDGWYTDAACTVAFDGVMPAQSTTLHAKWIEVVNAIESFASGDNHEVAYANGVLTISKTANGGEWNCIQSSLKGADIVGTGKLVLTIKGTAGEQILVKWNNSYETWVTCTGETQNIVIDYSDRAINKGASALILFAGGGKAGATGVFEITNLYFAKEAEFANEGFECKELKDEAPVIDVKYENGVLTLKKTANGGEWSNVSSIVKGDAIKGYNKLTIVVKGTAGEQILVKVNNQYETWVTCTGEKQTVVIDLTDKKINTSNVALLFFPAGAVKGESGVFEISSILFSEYVEQDIPAISFDALESEFVNNEEGKTNVSVNADGHLVVSKTADGHEWVFVKSNLTSAEIAKYLYLTVTVKGTAGEKVLFKVNNQKEVSVECDGTEQTVTLDFSQITINPDALALIIFPGAGKAGETGDFVISQLTFSTYPLGKDLLAEEFANNEEGKTNVSVNEDGHLVVSKTADGHEWVYVKSVATSEILEGYKYLLVTVKGTAEQKIIFKVNNQKEVAVVCDGTEQTAVLDISEITINPAVNAVIMFPGAGVAGETGEFVISSMELSAVKPALVVAADSIVNNEEGMSTVSVNEDGHVVVTKTEAGHEWIFVKSTIESAQLAGYTKFTATVKGTEGQKIIFKINNQKEVAVVCTGEFQTVSLDLSELSLVEANLALIMFPGAGVAGATGEFVISSMVFGN